MFDYLREKLKERLEYWNQDIEDDDVFDFSRYDLKDVLVDCDEFKLYRYMPANYFNIRNIEKQIIHLSINGVMNDIYEGLPKTEEQLPYNKLQKLEDLAMMTCFSEQYDNNLMWSHYACDHKGFCVEYDLKKLPKESQDICNHLFPVIYMDERIIVRDMESLIESHINLNKAIEENYVYDDGEKMDDILPLFLTKGRDWEYEKEWRIIYTKKQMYDLDEDELWGGNIPFDCISAVYLGYRIHPEIKSNILEICERISSEQTKVKVYQSKLDNEGYDIKFDLISK